jgi:hypothetical protein
LMSLTNTRHKAAELFATGIGGDGST